ncbi:MAG: hypothetical protein J7K00_03035 [Candidatus Diapherotrites archaeon]|nr:hypothetical protein [Candidatus Diapherotrites archaeon]
MFKKTHINADWLLNAKQIEKAANGLRNFEPLSNTTSPQLPNLVETEEVIAQAMFFFRKQFLPSMVKQPKKLEKHFQRSYNFADDCERILFLKKIALSTNTHGQSGILPVEAVYLLGKENPVESLDPLLEIMNNSNNPQVRNASAAIITKVLEFQNSRIPAETTK